MPIRRNISQILDNLLPEQDQMEDTSEVMEEIGVDIPQEHPDNWIISDTMLTQALLRVEQGEPVEVVYLDLWEKGTRTTEAP